MSDASAKDQPQDVQLNKRGTYKRIFRV